MLGSWGKTIHWFKDEFAFPYVFPGALSMAQVLWVEVQVSDDDRDSDFSYFSISQKNGDCGWIITECVMRKYIRHQPPTPWITESFNAHFFNSSMLRWERRGLPTILTRHFSHGRELLTKISVRNVFPLISTVNPGNKCTFRFTRNIRPHPQISLKTVHGSSNAGK